MRRIKTSLLLLALVAFNAAGAQRYSITWEAPTSREDGTPITATEIAEYRLYCEGKMTSIPSTPTEYVAGVEEVLPSKGTHSCHMTAVDTAGLEGLPSDSFELDWPYQVNPPRNILIITITQ